MISIFKIVLAASVISFATWIAEKKPVLAGFVMALPISSLIAIAFVQAEWRDPEKSTLFAKSIFLAVPLSLTFFLPFLFSKHLKIPFWGLYLLGVILLWISYFLHKKLILE